MAVLHGSLRSPVCLFQRVALAPGVPWPWRAFSFLSAALDSCRSFHIAVSFKAALLVIPASRHIYLDLETTAASESMAKP